MLYTTCIRPFLFCLEAERSHQIAKAVLNYVHRLPGAAQICRLLWQLRDPRLERTVLGLKFKNPVGLAAGFDKNGEYIAAMAHLGFGFVEVGTVTPLPQAGNPKPRVFRLPADDGLINRMGCNNLGVDVVAANLCHFRKHASGLQKALIIGANISKNQWTSNEDAVTDYVTCLNRLFEVVDYFVVNVSSPNTPGLRALQEKSHLSSILGALQQANMQQRQAKPILLKIAPDLSTQQLDSIIEVVQANHIGGIVATNTSIQRQGLLSPQALVQESGGLSGQPLAHRTTELIHYLAQKLGPSYTVIGVGGIHTPEDALEKMAVGASLIQLYTGLVYKGPGLVKSINQKLLMYHQKNRTINL